MSGGAAAKSPTHPSETVSDTSDRDYSTSEDDTEEEDEEEFQKGYQQRAREFRQDFEHAVAKAAPLILRKALTFVDLEKKVLAHHEGFTTVPFTVQLGPGEDVTLLDSTGNRLHISSPPNRATVEEDLYRSFYLQDFPEAVHSYHGDMGDYGRYMHILVKHITIKMGVIVRKGKKEDVETLPPVVTFVDEDAFVNECMDDEERRMREIRREERRRLEAKIMRKLVKAGCVVATNAYEKRKSKRKREDDA